MNYIDFEWDFNKAESNLLKHGIAFEEAITVFDDYNAVLFDIRIIPWKKIGLFFLE